MKKDIRDLTFEELEKAILAIGEPPHRARQVFLWLYGKNAAGFDVMTDLPKSLVAKLEKRFSIGSLGCEEHLTAKDGTEKFLWRLKDANRIETVLIKEKKRMTVCLSTQVGCRFRCPFCASGMKGFVRDLDVSEITGQLLSVREACAKRITNVVFMGMGEPLDNYDNLVKAIRIMNSPGGIALGARKMTVSTCGIIPGILKLKELGLQIELSVSLHAADNGLRNELVPVNRKYPLDKLIPACREYFERTGRIITLEYALIEGKNDSMQDATRLAVLAKGLRAKVNLLFCSPVPGSAAKSIGKEKIEKFKDKLNAKGAAATVRRPRGVEIMAACGQLAAQSRGGIL